VLIKDYKHIYINVSYNINRLKSLNFLKRKTEGIFLLRKSLALFLVFVLAMVAFTGCGSKPAEPASEEPAATEDQGTEEASTDAAEEKVLVFNLFSEPKTIDPQLNSATDGGHVISNTFAGLMRTVNGELQPELAESYEVSEDGLVYTFHLKDTLWSDGQPLVAGDFEYAWKRALDPLTASEYAFQLFYIKGGQEFFNGEGSADDVAVKALDEKTLQVELIAPTPYFLNLTSFYTLMPTRKDAVEQVADGRWAIDPEVTISNGPFKLVEYKSGDKMILAKNENYWNADAVKLDKIVATMIVDRSTALTAYEAGEVDVIDDMPTTEIPRLLAEDPTFQIMPYLGTYYYYFNISKEPFDNEDVRRALSLAIDRNAIVTTVSKGGQQPATGFGPAGLTDADGKDFRATNGDFGIDPMKASVEEAKELLAKAGYPNGEGFPKFELLYNTSEGHKAIAEAIQEMWKKNLGLEVSLANQDWAVFQDSRHNGSFDMARGGWIGDYSDPMTFLDLFTSYSGSNDTQWKSEDYDALIEESKMKSGHDRFEVLYAAEKMLMEDMKVMPIYYYTNPIMVKEHVKGWSLDILGKWYFGNVDIVK
jgi:oligopeptide transport system substrate-binding protein